MCRDLVLEVVLRRVLTAEGGDSSGRLQLIVDESNLRVLSSFLRMGDLHAEGVTSMELIARQREPLPGLDALYLITANFENIDLVLGDFKTEGAPQHRQVHLVFSESLKPDLMSKLAESKTLAPRVKSFLEVPLNFVLIQGRGFHFDMLDALPGMFPIIEPTLACKIAHKLVDVCRCLQVSSPCIRYAASNACKAVAEQVQAELSVCRASAKDEQIPCQLLILDRSVDMAATLVHEYTYEAIVYDLLDGGVLDIDQNLVSLPGPPAREVLLSEADSLWEEMKHMHLQDAKRLVDSKVEEVRGQSAAHQDASQMSTSDLLDMLRRSPEQRDTMDRLLLHLTLIDSIFSRLGAEHLTQGVGLLEQDIACGIDSSGKDVKATNLQGHLTKVFSELESVLPSETKLRILMLYFACMANISEVVRQKLIEMAKLDPEDERVLMAMLRTKLMEVPDSQRHKHGNGCVHRVTKEQAARFKRNSRTDGRFDLSRFEPRIKELVEQLTQSRLSQEEFPAFEGSDTHNNTLRSAGLVDSSAPGAPAAAFGGDQWSFAAWPTPDSRQLDSASEKKPDVTQRVVVFVVGGITHSELRVASEVAQSLPRGTEIILGGTALLTPRRLIRALRPRANRPDGAANSADPMDLT